MKLLDITYSLRQWGVIRQPPHISQFREYHQPLLNHYLIKAYTNQVKSITQQVNNYQGFIDNNYQAYPALAARGTSTPMCPASTSSNIKKGISKLRKINPAVKQILFKMTVVDVDAHADAKDTGKESISNREMTSNNIKQGDITDINRGEITQGKREINQGIWLNNREKNISNQA